VETGGEGGILLTPFTRVRSSVWGSTQKPEKSAFSRRIDSNRLAQNTSCRWSKTCFVYSRVGRKETRNYLFATFSVLSFTFPSGSTACLSGARGPGDFDARNRLGMLPRIATLAGADRFSGGSSYALARRHSGMTEASSWLRSSDRNNLRRRVAAWPQIQRNAVFSAGYIN
jgi:hypothetical protein